MTRIGRRLIEDFLLPALDDQRYGDLLKWIDRDSKCFYIRWSHKNAAKWNYNDTVVFQDWDRLKGHYHPEIKGYYMQAKQRFRAALYKLSSVRKMPCEDKRIKKYQLIGDVDKRKMNYMSKKNKSKTAYSKKVVENRVSVITKHTSLPEKPNPVDYASSTSPTFPDIGSSDKSDSDSDTMEYASCMHDYKMGQKKHNDMIICNHYNYMRYSPKKESPLQEVNNAFIRDNHCEQRIPHLPIQPVPVYNGMPSKRYESPRVLLVKTYNWNPNTSDVKEERADVGDMGNPCDQVLNLCVKSEHIESLSR